MSIQISFLKKLQAKAPTKTKAKTKAKTEADTAVFTVTEALSLGPEAKLLDKKAGGLVSHALEAAGDSFKGQHGQALRIMLPEKAGFSQALLFGLGAVETLDALACESAGGKLFPALKAAGAVHIALHLENLPDSVPAALTAGEKPAAGAQKKNAKSARKDQIKPAAVTAAALTPPELAAIFAGGLKLRSYSFDQCKSDHQDKPVKRKGKGKGKTTAKKKPGSTPARLDIICSQNTKAAAGFKKQDAAVEGTCLARDLMNAPPNLLFPLSYARKIRDELVSLGIEVELIDEKKLEKLGFGGVLCVGKGSIHPSCVVVMRWDGASSPGGRGGSAKSKAGARKKAGTKKTYPLALVGKGVTFDSGGISLKPGGGMHEMKMDMGGSAAIVGTMKALALRKAKADVVGIVGLTENMPSDRASRPGDIITSLSGKTIEILNTDAEGRLVLADCMTYIQKTYNPRIVIDVATLTGAIMVALGHEYCGAFVNDEALWEELAEASRTSGEKLWRMPLDPAYKKAMDSDIADLDNLGRMGRYGGACTAAGFLSNFVEEGVGWAHLDIAGKMMQKSDSALTPKGAAGFGVRLLNRLIADRYESGKGARS